MNSLRSYALFVCVLRHIVSTYAAVYEFTIIVPQGAEHCFYEYIEANRKFNIEFEVNYNRMGDYTIDFYARDPRNEPLEKRTNVDEASVDMESGADPSAAGDYRFCFVNTGSSLTGEKRVMFELSVEDAQGNKFDDKDMDFPAVNDELEQKYELKLANIVESLISTQMNLMIMKNYQDKARSSESKDRHVLENKRRYVDLWSMAQISFMLAVGLVQVVTIKSLFDQSYFLHKLFKKLRF